jgi:hypothetical protein
VGDVGQLQLRAAALTFAALLAAFALLLVMPSVARGADPASPATPLSVSNFVIIDPTGNLTVHGGPVMLAPGSGQHQFVFDTVGYRFSVINTSKVLIPGQYSTAVDTWLNLLNDPACNGGTTVGEAQIDQATYDQTGSVTSAAVQFRFRCSTGTFVYGTIAYQLPRPNPRTGYYLFGPDGGLWGFGNESYLTYLGTPHTQALATDIAGMVATSDGGGYFMAGGDGGVFAYGDAQFHGSMGGTPLNKPVVGIAISPDGGGYWEVASDGGIFAFGDARFHGSMGGTPLNKPVVAIAATPDAGGYWEVASDGGIFAFGDAQFHGSMGGTPLNKPVVAIAATPDGGGYWEVASDGGIFAFGDAQFHGSMGGTPLRAPVGGIASSPTGNGYWEGASDGGVFSFGDAAFPGSGLSVMNSSPPLGIVPG